MEVKAKLRYLKISPRKVRLVIDAIKGMDAEEAVGYLPHIHKRASADLLKLLKSCVLDRH